MMSGCSTTSEIMPARCVITDKMKKEWSRGAPPIPKGAKTKKDVMTHFMKLNSIIYRKNLAGRRLVKFCEK